MIKAVVAFDNRQGMATDNGIPWDLPADKQHFRELTETGQVLMGYRTYQEFHEPLQNRRNFVWTPRGNEQLREGFERVDDLKEFLRTNKGVWVIGGAYLFAQSLPYVDELHVTRIDADFHCTKFFPPFEDQFALQKQSEPQQQNGMTFTYETWARKTDA